MVLGVDLSSVPAHVGLRETLQVAAVAVEQAADDRVTAKTNRLVLVSEDRLRVVRRKIFLHVSSFGQLFNKSSFIGTPARLTTGDIQ